MRSHPTSGPQRTPDSGLPRRAPIGDIRQLALAALTPAVIEEHGSAAEHHRPNDQRDLLLSTKYAIPPLGAQALARPRLTDLLDQAADRKLTLVAAPAGYGKTSLLSAWAQHRTNTLAWLTLDPADDDPQHFWIYVVDALETLRPGLGAQALERLWDAPAAPIEAALTVLLNALAVVPDRLILVLDDYHVITAPAIHQALTFLLDHLPPQLRLVLASRTTPPLPIARLRARAELSELGTADLRFTQDEATVLLQQLMGLGLTDRDLATMTARTEGWITGLHLAGLARQHELDLPDDLIVRGTDRYLFDYLIEEVLKQQPEAIQTFLLQTSILDRMCGSLCDAILEVTMNDERRTMSGSISDADSAFSVHRSSSGDSYSQLLLEELERANLFIIPLDTERRWYRYHPLFCEALRAYLHRTQPAIVPDLQRRAVEWYEQHQTTLNVAPRDRESNPLIESLSPRELDVLRLVMEGLPNQAIAEALVIGVGTVKTHLLNIYAKLGVHSRTQAIVRARALGLV
jgi:LuxR family transcriptional regulator, maltose regulon positive regulatory protein